MAGTLSLLNGPCLIVLTASLLGCSPALANDPDAEKLVRQLGSKSFRDREDAAAKLVAIGPKAKPAVLAGLKDKDAEVSRRCAAIIKQIRENEREAFVAGKTDWPGPAARTFRDVVGESVNSRKLFAEILKEDSRTVVLERVGDSSKEATSAFASEWSRLRRAGQQAMKAFEGSPFVSDFTDAMREASRKAVEPGDVALVLFLATISKDESTKKVATFHEMLSASFIDLARGPLKDPFRKLFVAWLDQQARDEVLAEGLEGALYVPIPEAVSVARRLLQHNKASPAVIADALLLIGHHGKPQDIAFLDSFRKDTRQHWGYRGGKNELVEVQLRDLAVAMSLNLLGQDFEKYGFRPNHTIAWWADSTAAPFKSLQVFGSDNERDAAHKKAIEWLDKQPKLPGRTPEKK